MRALRSAAAADAREPPPPTTRDCQRARAGPFRVGTPGGIARPGERLRGKVAHAFGLEYASVYGGGEGPDEEFWFEPYRRPAGREGPYVRRARRAAGV